MRRDKRHIPQSEYVGEWLDGQMHGEGILYFNNEHDRSLPSRYVGTFQHGKMHKGAFHFDDGYTLDRVTVTNDSTVIITWQDWIIKYKFRFAIFIIALVCITVMLSMLIRGKKDDSQVDKNNMSDADVYNSI